MRRILREDFGIDGTRLEVLLGGRTNHLWQCGPWVVKLYDENQVPRHRIEQAVRLQAQVAATGLPVPAPRRTRSGALWTACDEGLVVVMPFISGFRRRRGRLNRVEAANLGAMLGNLHAALQHLTSRLEEPPIPPQTQMAAVRWAEYKERALAVEVPTVFDQLVVEIADYAAASLSGAWGVEWDLQPWQICHGDLHLDNILFDEAGQVAAVFDFDNSASGWTGAELMMVWNLCLCADPGNPTLTPEGSAFLAEYRKAGTIPDRAWEHLPFIYWQTLISNTWPAGLRFQTAGTYKPEWLEILELRYRTARWLEQNGETMSQWLIC